MAKDDMTEHRIHVYSGEYYDCDAPNPDHIYLEDIAHHLGNECRFAGACDPYYSVAEHSVLVSRLVPEEYKQAALLHDASEYVLCDIPRPMKHKFGEVYKALTKLCDAALGERFGVDPELFHSAEVAQADDLMLKYEGNELVAKWNTDKPELPLGTLTWGLGLLPAEAKQLFLQEAARLGLGNKVDYCPPLPEFNGCWEPKRYKEPEHR